MYPRKWGFLYLKLAKLSKWSNIYFHSWLKNLENWFRDSTWTTWGSELPVSTGDDSGELGLEKAVLARWGSPQRRGVLEFSLYT
jgi:hypothetical protein